MKPVLAIVVGGGPAPGINGVLSAVTIEALHHGIEVIGITGGINSLFKGDLSAARKLTAEMVGAVYSSGGSLLLTSRGMPDNPEKGFRTMLRSLKTLRVRYLVTIGGEGTLYVAHMIEKLSKGAISVIHVPKTIDNDLPLPAGLPTFGFETARHWGVNITKNLLEDAKTASRWYFLKTMGRYTGHLALGIGKSAGASITLIPEEFPPEGSFKKVADTLEGAIIKRLSLGKRYGVAVLAEGIAGRLNQEELLRHGRLEKDEFGRVSLSRLNLAGFMDEMVSASLKAKGIDISIVPKDIGYELRAAPPIPFDAEYTLNLGYGAIKYLIHLGGSGATVIFYEGKLKSIPFSDMLDEKTGKSRVRYVEPSSETYTVARDYMFRLEKEDFKDPKTLKRLAHAANLSPSEFKKKFEYLTVTQKT